MILNDGSSDSDFDEEDDPDKIEVPGGGKNLALAICTQEKKVSSKTEGGAKPTNTSTVNADHVLVGSLLDIDSFQSLAHDNEDSEDDGMGVVETYADYMPTKLKLGHKHPDPVVETASLSSVEPADVWYEISIPAHSIQSCALSALQLESITYASQQHEHSLPDGSRAGFLIGDGAGVGKGRTIAGIIYENYLKGRKRSIWISLSNDLKYDAERDLRDIGARKIQVHCLNKFKYSEISSSANGHVKKGVIFCTYSSLIGESSGNSKVHTTRLNQLLHWCGPNFDGPIIFDECHRAKKVFPGNESKSSKTGLTVLELQRNLPRARIVYVSATGASEPRDMAYMERLGIWGKGTPFPEFHDFVAAIEKRGIGAMEIVAMDMKLRGMYIARQLSFFGVSFRIDEVPLSDDFIKMYDRAVRMWVTLMRKFDEAAQLISAENRMKKTMWSQFWSSHQRFFKYLCIAAKVRHAVKIAREAVKCGKCVVIGLQSTGEARTLEQLERDDGVLSDFVSTARGVIETLVQKHFPAPDRTRIQRILGPNLKYVGTGTTTGKFSTDSPCIPSSKRKSETIGCYRPQKKKIGLTPTPPTSGNLGVESSSSSSMLAESTPESDEGSCTDDGSSDHFSDYNPFNSDSDSDNDPWDRRKEMQLGQNIVARASELEKRSISNSRSNTDLKKIVEATDGECITMESSSFLTVQDVDTADSNIVQVCRMKEELLNEISEFGKDLPPNTLDQLIDELGGSENVAEMTGRKGRIIQTEEGDIHYESRSESDIPLEILNLTEKKRFMDGEKMVAIISEAASSGISLQSDKRERNQKRRVHITLELPWSADRAIQQFGRTHRSNQVNAPEYVFLISNLAGERRFASIIAKRLESLGALTHGDRRATVTRDLSQFNVDNKYGRAALEVIMKTFVGCGSPLVPPPKEYRGDFFKDVTDAFIGIGLLSRDHTRITGFSLEKDYSNISKFLNRILGISVSLQNRIFEYFLDTLSTIVDRAKRSGLFDMGILDLGASEQIVRRLRLSRFFRKHATGIAPVELHMVQMERGMDWNEAIEYYHQSRDPRTGFFSTLEAPSNRRVMILAIPDDIPSEYDSDRASRENETYKIYRPNTGLQTRRETRARLRQSYRQLDMKEAKCSWIEQYEASLITCIHRYGRGSCKNLRSTGRCEIGLRRRSYNILSGSVLSVWNDIESTLASFSGQISRIQVIRVRTAEGTKIVGILIPDPCIESVRGVLAHGAEQIEEIDHL